MEGSKMNKPTIGCHSKQSPVNSCWSTVPHVSYPGVQCWRKAIMAGLVVMTLVLLFYVCGAYHAPNIHIGGPSTFARRLLINTEVRKSPSAPRSAP